MSDHPGSTQANAREQAARQWVRRVTWLRALRQAVALSTLWALAWGVGVLAGRVGMQWQAVGLLWGAAGFVPLWIVAGAWAWRQRPSVATARAVLDRHNHAGGLIVAEAETPLQHWADRLNAPRMPRVRWRGGQSWTLAGVAMLFVLGAFLAPTELMGRPQPDPPLHVAGQVNRLNDQLETLAEEEILDEQEADALREDLEQIEEQALARDPQRTWEALDYVHEQLAERANEEAQNTRRQNERLNESDALAEALSEPSNALDESLEREAMAALRERMSEAAREQAELNEQLNGQLGEALNDETTQLSAEQLRQLRDASQQARERMARTLQELRQARLIDDETLQACMSAGRMDGERLGQCLAQGMSLQQAMLVAAGQRPGRGGVNRGRGDAPMAWREKPSSEDGVSYEAQQLPPGDLPSLEESRRVGLSSTSPEEDTAAGPSAGGALSGDVAGAGGASVHRVLPEHRGAVQRYFDRSRE